MKTFVHVFIAVLSLLLMSTTIRAQVLDPNDPIIEYDPSNPPSLPANGSIGKWVRTDRLNWNTDSYKSYLYRGNKLLPFRLKFPKNYNPQDSKKYPLIIMLHGAGEQGTIYDNELNLKHGGEIHRNAVDNGKFDGFVMFPQAYGAWHTDYFNTISALINKMANEANVDPFRVIVHGLSNGGKATWTFLIDHTIQVAAAIPMSATTSDRTNNVLNRIKYTPIWSSQGGVDTNPTPSASRSLAELIWGVGGNLRYTLYPELGHGIWNVHYNESDFFPFMMRANKVNPWPLFEQSEFCPGETISVRLGVTPGFEGYQWRKDGTVISGANSNELLVMSEGVYDVRVMRNGVWSYWSPIPVEVKTKETTQTPPIQLADLHSKVIPSPDGRNYTVLELPEGFEEYAWQKVGSGAVIGTNRTLNATSPGNYIATVTEKFGCSSVPSAPFTVVDANGANGPGAAVNVTANTLSKTSIQVAWSDNPNAPYQETGFEIYRATQSGGPYDFVNLTGANVFSFTDTNLLPGTKYFYIVRAVNDNAASGNSNQASATTNSDTEPPSAPLNLNVISTTENSVDLAWDPSTDDVGVDKYIVYRNGIQSLITSENEVTIFNLSPHQVYNFTIKARDFTGNISPASNQVTVATVNDGLKYDYFEGSFDALPDFNSLTPVSSGRVDNFTLDVREQNDNFALKFEGKINIPTSGNYTFFTTSDDGSKLYIGGFSESNLVVNNDGLHGNQERSGNIYLTAGSHPIYVTFFEKGGGETLQVRWDGPGFNKQLIPTEALKDDFVMPGQPPAFPTQLTATAVSYNQINLTWTDNSNNETGFQIYRAENPAGPFTPIALTNSNVVSYQDKGLNAATTYYYKVEALGQYGESGFSDELSSGVNYAEYYGTWSALPNFNNLTPVNTGVVDNFTIAPRTRNDNFAFKLDGFITIPTSGNYTFYTSSDDGSKLYIGGYNEANLVVNNDGLHGTQERNGSRNLTAGRYPITVTFFERGGGEVLEVRWQGPGISKQLIPSSALKDPDINATTLPLPAAPSAPTNLTAEVVSNIRINLSWNDNSNDEDKFEIFRSASNNNNYLLIATLPSNNTGTVNYSDAELFPGVTYFYKVVASNIGGSATSNEVSDTTPTDVPDNNAPPVLTEIEDVVVGSEETLQINISATDDPSDVITLSALNLPGFANFTDQGNGSGVLTLNPQVDHVGEYQNVIIKASDGKGGESEELFTITVFNSTQASYYINFTESSQFSEGSPWNNFITNASAGNSMSNLVDKVGNTSSIGITLLDSWNGTNNLGMSTGNNSGVVPDNVMRTSIWINTSNNRRIRVTGLDDNRLYNFIFFSSRDGGGNRYTSYTIDGKTVSLNASHNTQNTVQLDGVLPVNGEVIINVARVNGSSYGYLNALIIEGYVPGEINVDPSDLQTAGISNSAIQLGWQDNSPNESGFEIWRSTSANGTYNLIHTTGADVTSYTDNSVTANTIYYYKVRANINGESTSFSNVSSAATISYFVSINYNFEHPQAAPWNNTSALPDPGLTLTNLKTNSNANSGMSMTIVEENPMYDPAIYGFSGDNPFGMNTGNNSGVVPDNVMRSTYWLDQGRVAEIKISGLDISYKYNFVFFASRDGAGNRTTNYSIGDEVVSLNAAYNINNTVQINGVIPDNNGEVVIKITAGSGSAYGYIGALIVQTYPSGDNLNARYAAEKHNKYTDGILDEENELFGSSVSVFTAYPNPVENQLTVEIVEGNTDRAVNVILRDNIGRIIFNGKSAFDESGQLYLDLNDKSIPSGLFMLEVFFDGGERKVFRLIKK